MGINSPLKKILASWTDSPIAGFLRTSDNTQKLDVAISESEPFSIGETIDLPIKSADSISLDAFGRWRVSNTAQRLDVEFIYNLQPLLMEQVTSGGASITHNSATRDVTLAIVNATNGTIASFPSHYHVPYTPGNGQLIDITGTLDYAGIGGGTTSVFIRSAGVDVALIPQGSWNKNLLLDVDWTKSQIFTIDFQSLKVGRVRFGLVRNGVAVTCHEVYNDNIRKNGYWQHPNLPLNWRIFNSGNNTIAEIGYFNANNGVGFRYTIPANANAQMLAICGTVKSEGGNDLFDISGYPFTASNLAATKTVSTTLVPLLSIQIKTTLNSITNRGLVIPKALSFLTDQPILYQVVLNPTLTGAAFGSVNANSLVNSDVTASALTGGTVLESGYSSAGNVRAGADKAGLTGRVPLSLNYAGTVGDILTLAAVRVSTNNATSAASLDWTEIH